MAKGKTPNRAEDMNNKEPIFKGLDKNAIVYDLETTGVDVNRDEIITLSAIKIAPDGIRNEVEWMFKPSFPIPAAASAVHGIYDKDVADKLSFAHHANDIVLFFKDCYTLGFNNQNYDQKLLNSQLKRVGLEPIDCPSYDAYQLYLKHSPRKLGNALAYYCKEDIKDAHTSMGDCLTTLKIIVEQLKIEGKTIPELCLAKKEEKDSGRFIVITNGKPTVNFGKYKGTPMDQVDVSYLKWIVTKSELPKNLKKEVKKYL